MASAHNVPSQVLTDAFREHLANRQLLDLVFLTYSFEPSFFENEILSAFVDVVSSASEKVRLAMMEEQLRTNIEVAVYYDPNALCAGDGSSRLPIRRIPVRRKTGCFHPKNVLALVQDEDSDEEGNHRKHLIVGTMSANTTRAGWWRNVEACHIEVLSEGGAHPLRDDLLALVRLLKQEVGDDREPHTALEHIRQFVARIDPISQRSRNGVFCTRMSLPGESVEEFLARQLGRDGQGLNLEVISPFFDDADAKPLRKIVERFAPVETRVFLPRNAKGEAKCDERFFQAVEGIDGCVWAQLPEPLVRGGSSDAAAERDVHAKVYRFFHPTRRFEVIFLGSPNLTSAAHSGKGNFESGVLVDVQPKQVSDWWLKAKAKAPKSFARPTDDDSRPASALTALSIRYDWSTHSAELRWDGEEASPPLELEIQTSKLRAGPLSPGVWTLLGETDARIFRDRLRHSSYVRVSSEGLEPATVLVLESAMEEKPTIALELTAADILKYWALLTPEQRAEFHEHRLDSLSLHEAALIHRRLGTVGDSMFDQFAGIFHSFASLEQQLREAATKKQTKVIHARLFADKYDSLPMLLTKVDQDLAKSGDAVRAYVILLCATQLLRAVMEFLPEADEDVRKKARSQRLKVDARLQEVRELIELPKETPRGEFFGWFEGWFLKRVDRQERDAA